MKIFGHTFVNVSWNHWIFSFVVFNIFCFPFLFPDEFHNNSILLHFSQGQSPHKKRLCLDVTCVIAQSCVCLIQILKFED